MSLVQRMAKNVRGFAAFAALASIAQLIYVVLSARHFGPEIVGLYAIWLALVSGANVLISSPCAQLVLENPKKNPSAVQLIGSLVSIIPGVFISILCVLFMFGESLRPNLWLFVLLSMLWSATETAALVNEAALVRQERLAKLGCSHLISSLVQVAGLALANYLGQRNLEFVLALGLLYNIARIIQTQQRVSGWASDIPSISRSLIRYARLLNLSSVSTIYVTQADRAIVGVAMGSEASGYYSRAMSVIQLPSSLFARFGSKALIAAGLNTPRGAGLIREVSNALIVLGLVLTLISFLISEYAREIFYYLLGPEWVDGAIYLEIVAFASFPRIVVKVCDGILRSYGDLTGLRTSYLLYAVFFSVALLVLFWMRTPAALYGIVVSLYASSAVFYLATVACLRR